MPCSTLSRKLTRKQLHPQIPISYSGPRKDTRPSPSKELADLDLAVYGPRRYRNHRRLVEYAICFDEAHRCLHRPEKGFPGQSNVHQQTRVCTASAPRATQWDRLPTGGQRSSGSEWLQLRQCLLPASKGSGRGRGDRAASVLLQAVPSVRVGPRRVFARAAG